jgi:hypothetical protein
MKILAIAPAGRRGEGGGREEGGGDYKMTQLKMTPNSTNTRKKTKNVAPREAGNGARIRIVREVCCRNQASILNLVHKISISQATPHTSTTCRSTKHAGVGVSQAPRFHGFVVCLTNGLPDRIRPSEPSSGGPAAGVRLRSQALEVVFGSIPDTLATSVVPLRGAVPRKVSKRSRKRIPADSHHEMLGGISVFLIFLF